MCRPGIGVAHAWRGLGAGLTRAWSGLGRATRGLEVRSVSAWHRFGSLLPESFFCFQEGVQVVIKNRRGIWKLPGQAVSNSSSNFDHAFLETKNKWRKERGDEEGEGNRTLFGRAEPGL